MKASRSATWKRTAPTDLDRGQLPPRPKFAHVPRGRPQIASSSLVVEQAVRPPLVDIDAYRRPPSWPTWADSLVPASGPHFCGTACLSFRPGPCERGLYLPGRRWRSFAALPRLSGNANGYAPSAVAVPVRAPPLRCRSCSDGLPVWACRLCPFGSFHFRLSVVPAPGRRVWGTRLAEGAASSQRARARPCPGAVHGLRKARRQCALAHSQVRSVL